MFFILVRILERLLPTTINVRRFVSLQFSVYVMSTTLYVWVLTPAFAAHSRLVHVSLATHSHLAGHAFRPPWSHVYVSFAARYPFLTRVYSSVITRSSTDPNVCETSKRVWNINVLYPVSDPYCMYTHYGRVGAIPTQRVYWLSDSHIVLFGHCYL